MGHRVKCFYCGHTFDRDKEPFVPIEGKRRYAHLLCYNRAMSVEKENEENMYSTKVTREDFDNDGWPVDKFSEIEEEG